MDKVQFLARSRWDLVMWLAGIVNALSLLPQLYALWTTRQAAGLSVAMFAIIGALQATFAFNAWLRNDRGTMWGMTFALIVNLAIIASVVYFR